MGDIVDLRRKERKVVHPSVQQCTPCEAQIIDSLKNMEDLLQGISNLSILADQQKEIISALQTINDSLSGKYTTTTGMWYNRPETPILVASPVFPVPPFDQISDPITGATGYQRETVYTQLNRISKRITIINDGTTDIFVIASNNGQTWSLEAPIRIGEARTFFDVYELRVRGPVAGDVNTKIGNLFSGGVYRISEYDYWLAYATAASSSTAVSNSGAFVAFSLIGIGIPGTGTQLALPGTIIIPNGFSLEIRATPGNTGQVFLANSGSNTGVATSRITLNAGDAVSLFVNDASLVWVAGSAPGQNIDILVEQ